jgi:hypothetical protein
MLSLLRIDEDVAGISMDAHCAAIRCSVGTWGLAREHEQPENDEEEIHPAR